MSVSALDRDLVIDATVGGRRFSPQMSTDARAASGDDGSPISDPGGGVEYPALDNVLDMETARPLIAALPERQRTVFALLDFSTTSSGTSNGRTCRLLAKCMSRGY